MRLPSATAWIGHPTSAIPEQRRKWALPPATAKGFAPKAPAYDEDLEGRGRGDGREARDTARVTPATTAKDHAGADMQSRGFNINP
ncbi:hypothetical protein ZWY2020_046733 [Hordeum vulgare]|nr:hypothetical protein ZWY2020_046733 [Hordeum vulgare]